VISVILKRALLRHASPMKNPPAPFDAARLLLWLAVFLSLGLLIVPAFFAEETRFATGHWFVGGDTYMRVLRVREWIEGGAWYDSFSPRSNWPYGEKLHWTRPMDLAIALLALPFLPFFALKDALYAAGLIVSPLFFLLALWVLLWAARPFLDMRGRIIFVLLFALQPTMHYYFVFARPDHHSLILLVFAVTLALLARHAHDPDGEARLPAWAGAAAAFGLWVSIETLTIELYALLALGLTWIVTGEDKWLAALRRFAFAGALALAAFLAVERPPGEWLTSETYDRLSSVHVFLLALIALGIEGVRVGRRRFDGGWARRLLLAASAAAMAALLMALLYPDFFKGPFGAAMDPRLQRLWLDTVNEFQTLAQPSAWAAVTAIFILGPLLWMAVWAVWTWNGPARTPDTLGFLLTFLVAAALFAPLTVVQFRWAAYMGVIGPLPWAMLLTRILDWRGGPVRAGVPVLRTPLFLAVALGHIAAGAAADAGIEDETPPLRQTCRWRDIQPFLDSAAFGGGEPQTIFNFAHNGPEILYRTQHRVIGTPYHRNTQGILDSYAVLGGTDMAQAQAILQRRGADYLLTCVGSMDESLLLREPGDILIRRLVENRPPPWLVQAPLPDGLERYFRLYRFVPDPPERP